ncbi:hypothetical protein PHO31112_01646 [Pandoraea horticolens]|uniref:Uncharacterized protein n=1 Tax=Pandoraea horticolens TaxID=2508298 RepID=A0A5E4TVB3_9BURK|nr:hypothetical protein PHO31112_01646 [Pandoraea horticolens]
MLKQPLHPLEENAKEAAYAHGLRRTSPTALAAYRRAVEVLTGSLPTWASRAKPGRKPGAQCHTGE